MMTLRFVSLVPEADAVGIAAPLVQGGGGLLDFADGGVMMYPIAFSGLVALGLTLWAGWQLASKEARLDARIEAEVDGVLFWGGYALLLGILGTVIGIAHAARAIELAGDVSASLAWGGIRVALITTIWGGAVLGAAALSWFLLRVRCRGLLMRSTHG